MIFKTRNSLVRYKSRSVSSKASALSTMSDMPSGKVSKRTLSESCSRLSIAASFLAGFPIRSFVLRLGHHPVRHGDNVVQFVFESDV